ncbi:hypothetical protein IE53DRAFT_154692 [Violaceomyces palustris]|uniref:Uncharacterized protein n=1 Tax=Violaceomyces palustris TaxID=1673888 RepID=A0ACD0NTZ3_9BASI|nr:hypothetical protein IE53DRAFT_154692 [Violaceomyces palustris]
MPLVKRKVVELAPPPIKNGGDDPEVFYLSATGEIFTEYEAYANRLSFYNQRLFQCELTGKVNMTYFEAAASERKEAILLHRHFPEPLKGPVLRTVQFKITSRLDNLVDMVFDRFKDRFFGSEAVFVEVQGDRYYARIKEVFPPKALVRTHQGGAAALTTKKKAQGKKSVPTTNGFTPKKKGADTPRQTIQGDHDTPLDAGPDAQDVIHRIGTDLNFELSEANRLDDAAEYLYQIQLVDDEGKFTGSLMEARAEKLSRDRLTFSKAILRKYMRECVSRDASVGSPWTVKPWLAKRYDIPTSPSDEMLKKNNLIKDARRNKRKKPVEADEASNAKKKAKSAKAAARESLKAAAAAAAAEKKRLAEEEKAAKEKAKEEERLRAERKRNMKYPGEDLDLDPISPRELKHQVEGEFPRRKERPIPTRGLQALPVPADVFDEFMMTFYFLMAFGKPLLITPFTLDEYEAALRHSTHEPSCPLIQEIHSVLLNAIVRDGIRSKDVGSAALTSKTGGVGSRDYSASVDPDQEIDSVVPSREGSVIDHWNQDGADDSVQAIYEAAAKIGKGWDMRILKVDEGRDGWESHLVGCLLARATSETFPRLTGILSHMTAVEHPDGRVDGNYVADTYLSVVDRYPAMALRDKIHIISFLCQLAVMTKSVRAYFEECDLQLTELRKEKVELSRAKRKYLEERFVFEGGKRDEANGNVKKEEGEDEEAKENEDGSTALPTKGEDGSDSDSDSEKDELESSSDEAGGGQSASDSGSEPFRRTFGSRQEKLREKALQRKAEEAQRLADLAKAKEAHRARLAESKQLAAERKRLDEEEDRLFRKEAAIERDYRKYILAPRLRPLGEDRFKDKYWWFDGIGNASLTNPNGSITYQTGRLFVQGASQYDRDELAENVGVEQLSQRRKEELTEEGCLEPDEWAAYTEIDQIEELISWMRIKGIRENVLKSQLLKFRYNLESGIQKRNSDLNGVWKEGFTESRRSSRSKADNPTMRLPHMVWKNKADTGKVTM